MQMKDKFNLLFESLMIEQTANIAEIDKLLKMYFKKTYSFSDQELSGIPVEIKQTVLANITNCIHNILEKAVQTKSPVFIQYKNDNYLITARNQIIVDLTNDTITLMKKKEEEKKIKTKSDEQDQKLKMNLDALKDQYGQTKTNNTKIIQIKEIIFVELVGEDQMKECLTDGLNTLQINNKFDLNTLIKDFLSNKPELFKVLIEYTTPEMFEELKKSYYNHNGDTITYEDTSLIQKLYKENKELFKTVFDDKQVKEIENIMNDNRDSETRAIDGFNIISAIWTIKLNDKEIIDITLNPRITKKEGVGTFGT